MKVIDLVKLTDVEDMLFEIRDFDSEEHFFSFWSADYYNGELSTVECHYIENLEVKGVHIEPDGMNVILVCSVEMPEIKKDPTVTAIMKNVYGEEFYNELKNLERGENAI